MQKKFTQAPLPFQGQKRNWNGEFKTALKQFNHCNLFIDLFGGSGLLSRMVKDTRPDAVVLYNDFDDYHRRIEAVEHTNELLNQLRDVLGDYPRGKLLTEDVKTAVLKVVKKADEQGFVDYITLSSSLLFSMNYAVNYDQLAKQSMYNTIRRTDYDVTGYLDGLEVVKWDYRELFANWRDFPNVCFLIDPPYLSTDAQTYTGYWKLKDYLDVLHTLKNSNYFYFTSNKSNVVELCDWMERNYATANPFHGAVKKELTTHMTHNSSYVDMMLYKRREDE